MQGQRGRRSEMLKIVAWDIVLLLICTVAFLPTHLEIAGAIYLPTILIFNLVMLRRYSKTVGTPTSSGETRALPGRTSLYIGSAMFFIGTLGGLLTIVQEKLPRATLPFLLFPMLIAVYCLIMARRISTRASKPDTTGTNHPC